MKRRAGRFAGKEQVRTSPARSTVRRKAAAAVEFAVCLPVLLVFTFGMIEAANSIYVKQVLTQVAYEGARVLSTPGGNNAAATLRCNEILAVRNIQGATFTFSPTVTATTKAGTEITVTVLAPLASNTVGTQMYFDNVQIRSHIVMVRN